jgi:hypothetical protein
MFSAIGFNRKFIHRGPGEFEAACPCMIFLQIEAHVSRITGKAGLALGRALTYAAP